MKVTKNIVTKQNGYLTVFILSCLFTFYTIGTNNINNTLILLSVKYLFLILYYTSSVRKNNYYLIAGLVLFYIASVFFTFHPASIYGIIILSFARLSLIQLPTSSLKFRSINWDVFLTVCILFLVISFVIFSFYPMNTVFFYVSLIATFFLILLLSFSFLSLLKTLKRGNILFFIAIALFIISDAISGTQRYLEVSTSLIIMASVLYNIAYFLLVKSDIEKQESLK